MRDPGVSRDKCDTLVTGSATDPFSCVNRFLESNSVNKSAFASSPRKVLFSVTGEAFVIGGDFGGALADNNGQQQQRQGEYA
jgi:hypothetical protein